jgi:hypothetical protein
MTLGAEMMVNGRGAPPLPHNVLVLFEKAAAKDHAVAMYAGPWIGAGPKMVPRRCRIRFTARLGDARPLPGDWCRRRA